MVKHLEVHSFSHVRALIVFQNNINELSVNLDSDSWAQRSLLCCYFLSKEKGIRNENGKISNLFPLKLLKKHSNCQHNKPGSTASYYYCVCVCVTNRLIGRVKVRSFVFYCVIEPVSILLGTPSIRELIKMPSDLLSICRQCVFFTNTL